MSVRNLSSAVAAAIALGCAGSSFAQCGSATTITVGDTPFDTAGATEVLDLTGICDPGPFGDDMIYHTIWFKWVADTTDTYEISSCGQANYDTRFAVLENGCDPATNTIACLDDTAGCATFTATLAFPAVQGSIYYFAVGGYSATTTSGSGTLTLALAGEVGGGVCGEDNPQDCCVAGGAPGCSDATCCETVCAADPFCCDTAWDGICAGEALSLCQRICLVECPGPEANIIEAEVCGEDSNGGCNMAFPAYEALALGDVVSGTYWAKGGTRDTDWYTISIAEGTELTATLYSAGPGVTLLLSGSCPASVIAVPVAPGCPTSWTKCVPPGDYVVFVGLGTFDGFPCFGGLPNEYVLEVTGVPCDVSAPKNDECEQAAPIGDGDTPYDTTFATTSLVPLDPSCDKGFGLDFVNDLWFVWEASCTGIATVSTCNQADYDTRLAAYADCFGTQVGCNDDGAGCAGLTSHMIFPCEKGVSYYLRVGGFDSGGTGTLSISCSLPVDNDECDTATPIADGGPTPFTTVGATTSQPPLDGSCDEGFGLAFVNDVWFDYVASCTGTVTVTACNTADFDTRLAAYSDCVGTLVGCNDDSAGCGLTSTMTFQAVQGEHYFIRVGGFSSSGTGTLAISCVEGGGGCTSNDTCACPTVIALGDTAFSTVGAVSDPPTTSPAECGAFANGFFRDIWYVFTPESAGHLVVSTCSQATYDTRLELWIGCPDGGGALVACNDDGEGCTGFTSIMEADIDCRSDYYIRVGSYAAGTTGTGTISLTLTPTGPCGRVCTPGPDRNGDGCVNGGDITVVLGAWDPDGSLGNGLGEGDANCDTLVNGADITEILGGWQPICP